MTWPSPSLDPHGQWSLAGPSSEGSTARWSRDRLGLMSVDPWSGSVSWRTE